MINAYLPHPAEIIGRVQQSDSVFTLHLRFTDAARQRDYRFAPGQFNMVYLFGAGEVPISISSDPDERDTLAHTIRAVGRVTHGLARLKTGDTVGLRGPYGRGWPLEQAQGRDVVLVSGGLGCAPTVSMIDYVSRRRERFGRLLIIQGVKQSCDLIYRDRYAAWAQWPDTQVLIAASRGDAMWPWHVGPVTDLLGQAQFDPANTIAMMCGPEGMMIAAARLLAARGVDEAAIHLSMERNMQCAVGLCGHCQFGGHFVCRDGPVFAYAEVKDLLGVPGF